MVVSKSPTHPGHIDENHWNEWLDSRVDPSIIAANVRSMQGQEVYEWLMEDLWGAAIGGHGSQYVTGAVQKYFNRYESVAAGGGWCCRGLDPLNEWARMRWGQFKPNIPRIDGFHESSEGDVKVIKYEPLPGQPNRAFFLANPLIEGYWENVRNNPSIAIVLTEGAKKAGAGLSQGYATIALPGVNAGYRVKDDTGSPIKPELLTDLKVFAQPGRRWILAFDQDSKNATRKKVEKALAKQGLLLIDAGCEVAIAKWSGIDGKGLDDFLACRGYEAFAECLADAEPLDVDMARVLLAGDDAHRLEALVKQYASESNPYRRALIETQIGDDFKIRGTQLKELVYYASPKPAIEFVPMAAEAAVTFDEIEARSLSSEPSGLVSGFRSLDRVTQGYQRGDLIIFAGRPSMGKSAFMAQSVYNVAQRTGLPCPVFSLEMSRRQLLYRLISMESGIPLQNLRAGRLNKGQWDGLLQSIGDATAPPVFVSNDCAPTVEQMTAGLMRFKEEQGELGLIMIDYLQLMPSKSENRNQGLAEITRQLKLTAQAVDAPIVVLSQLSRGLEGRSEKRPINSDLRDSGAIEQDGDLIMMLYRDEVYNKETVDSGIAEVIITKHRNGPLETVKLLFEKELTCFRNLEEY